MAVIAMPPKSIWRGPNAQHFALVHRSQQDPLLYDADASKRVLKPVQRQNERHAEDEASTSASAGRLPQSREQLERELGVIAAKERENVGEAAEYGIYFDDTEYDYMQHLRSIGGNDNSRRGGKDEEQDADVILLEAPQPKHQAKAKALASEANEQRRTASVAAGGNKSKSRALQDGEAPQEERIGGLRFKEPAPGRGVALPADVLPSQDVVPRTFAEDRAEGLRPDMDPHLRQVLEALDDDAFLMRTARGAQKDQKPAEEADVRSAETADGDGAATSNLADIDGAQLEESEEDEEDIDDFFENIVEGGELEEGQKDPEWRELPPEGEESLYLDSGARAARELLELKQQGKNAEDLSLESRVALFKKAAAEQRSATNSEDGHDSDDTASPSGGARTTKVRVPNAPSSTGSKSIFGEKGATHKSRHAGSKARLAGTFYAPSSAGGSTAFSMSSSAMERNHGLTGLDDQFARMEKIYEDEGSDDDDEQGFDDGHEDDDEGVSPAEKLKQDPRDIEKILDDFLDKNEVVGKRLRQRLGHADATSVEKVDMIRQELGGLRMIDRQTWDEAEAAGLGPSESVEQIISRDLRAREQARRDADVETIHTTRTNLANRPRTITAAQSIAPSRVSRIVPPSHGMENSSNTSAMHCMPRVKIDPRTGAVTTKGYIKLRPRRLSEDDAHSDPAAMPSAKSDSESESDLDEGGGTGGGSPSGNGNGANGAQDGEDSDGTETDEQSPTSKLGTLRRDRNETADEKRARKAAVKTCKQARRTEKAQRKADFKEASLQGRGHSVGNQRVVAGSLA